MNIETRTPSTTQAPHAMPVPPRSGPSGFIRDLEARWAERLRDSRTAFAALVLELPPVYREFLLDGDLDGPRLGHRWPLVQLDACFRRMTRCAPVQNDPAVSRAAEQARVLKHKIDVARRALILANLRLAIRLGKPLNGPEIVKLGQQLAEVSRPGGHGALEADDVWEILRFVATSRNSSTRERALREAAIDALSVLTPNQERVLRLRIGIGGEGDRTLRQIGEVLGVPEHRVRQLETSALWKLATTREIIDMAEYLARACEGR